MRKQWIILLVTGIFIAACAPQPAAQVSAPVDEQQGESEPLPSQAEQELAPASPEDNPPPGAESQFSTDFSQHTIPYTEVLSGGPPKDGIPAIDSPAVVSITDADAWLEGAEAVVVVSVDGTARAYPVQILMWHEIVNDSLNNQPVSVTYCPLCNTAIAFDRNFDGQLLDFGTTGRLRFSNLIMYDRQTETWWQQATGEGIAGEYAGSTLTTVPAFLLSWEQFKQDYPRGDVLSKQTGFPRDYGSNPYVGYDAAFNDPFLYQGPEIPDALPPMARVLTIDSEDETVAFPYSVLEAERVLNETVADQPVAVFWQAGTASALDSSTVGGGKDVGSATSFSRDVDGQVLTFEPAGDSFRDQETSSIWNNLGVATGGELAGTALEPVVSINHFWFSWAAFRPETRVIGQTTTSSADPDSTGSDQSANTTAPGNLTQDFALDLYQDGGMLDGDRIAFSALFQDGKPVVAMFFAGLCPFCRADLPILQDVYRQTDGAFRTIVIDIGPYTNLGSQADGKAMLADLSITLPAGALEDPSALTAYGVLGTPAFLFFDAEGELVRSWVGSLKTEQLDGFVSEII